MPQSHVSDQLIAAYRSANYRVESSCEPFVLRIDQHSEPLARLFATSGHHCAAFVTACNPLGTLQTFEANQAASARLAGRLGQLARGEGRGRIFIVEPTGSFEDDPNLTDKRFSGNMTASYRSIAPLRITGELKEWVGHAPEQLQEMKDNLVRMKREGGDAIIED